MKSVIKFKQLYYSATEIFEQKICHNKIPRYVLFHNKNSLSDKIFKILKTFLQK